VSQEEQQQQTEGQAANETPQAGPELEEARRERDQFRAMAQRAQADLINYRRRTDEERQQLSRNATNQMLMRFVPVVDDLQRAVGALPADAPESWRQGVMLILRHLQQLIENEGLVAYNPEPGASFDPVLHEAVYFQPTTEHEPGTVVTSVRAGYRSSDRILRPAQVVVAQPKDEAARSASGGQ